MTSLEDDGALDAPATALAGAHRVVAFTGAGVSTESGIPDFRSPGGVWDTFDPEDFTYRRFLQDPARYWRLRARLMEALDLDEVEPNPAHLAIAALEEAGVLRAVVTQNIDGLHQRAGNAPSKVLEVHGNARRVRCVDCGVERPYAVARDDVAADRLPPACPDCDGVLKPATVLFGEPLPRDVLRRAEQASRAADVYLVVGSSLAVHPAADLPRVALANGAIVVIVNRDPTPMDGEAHHVLHGEAGTLLPRLLEAAGLPPAPNAPKG